MTKFINDGWITEIIFLKKRDLIFSIGFILIGKKALYKLLIEYIMQDSIQIMIKLKYKYKIKKAHLN